jgi:hypothetical protein
MLTTTTLLKANYLNIDALDTDRDATITECIKQAGSIIKTLCNQPIEQESLTYEFRGGGTSAIPLADQLLGGSGYSTKLIPYTVPSTLVAVSHRTLPTDSWTADTGCTLFVDNLQTRLYHPNGFGYAYYKATLNVGYTTIPDDIVHAVSELALYIYNETSVSNESRAGLASRAITQNSITSTLAYADVIARIRPILTKYTIYAV